MSTISIILINGLLPFLFCAIVVLKTNAKDKATIAGKISEQYENLSNKIDSHKKDLQARQYSNEVRLLETVKKNEA